MKKKLLVNIKNINHLFYRCIRFYSAERGGLSQLPVLSFRWTSARTLGSHPIFLHFLRREGDYLNFLYSVFDGLRLEPWVLIPSSFILLRREGDSNPRYVTVNTLSKRARSTALPPLRKLSLQK